MPRKNLANSDLRSKAKEANVALWEIADFVGRCELTISRRFRKELSEQEKTAFSFIIDEIAAQKNGGTVSEAEKDRVVKTLLNIEAGQKNENASR